MAVEILNAWNKAYVEWKNKCWNIYAGKFKISLKIIFQKRFPMNKIKPTQNNIASFKFCSYCTSPTQKRKKKIWYFLFIISTFRYYIISWVDVWNRKFYYFWEKWMIKKLIVIFCVQCIILYCVMLQFYLHHPATCIILEPQSAVIKV